LVFGSTVLEREGTKEEEEEEKEEGIDAEGGEWFGKGGG
jgi:hypothetical protein